MLNGLRDELPNRLQGWLHYRICQLVQALLWLLWRSRLPTSAGAEMQKGSPHFTLITDLPFYLMPQSLHHDVHASDHQNLCSSKSFYFKWTNFLFRYLLKYLKGYLNNHANKYPNSHVQLNIHQYLNSNANRCQVKAANKYLNKAVAKYPLKYLKEYPKKNVPKYPKKSAKRWPK